MILRYAGILPITSLHRATTHNTMTLNLHCHYNLKILHLQSMFIPYYERPSFTPIKLQFCVH